MNIRPKTVRRLALVLVLCAVAVAALLAVRARNDAQRRARLLADRDAGIVAFRAGDYPVALERLRNYVRPGTTDFDALLAFATARARVELPNARHLPEAIQLFELLRSLRPTDPGVRQALLDLYTQAGYSTEAIRLADAVLAEAPADVPALRARSIALARSARYDDALRASLALNEAAPTDLSAHLQTYWLLRRTKAPQDEILARYRALHERSPEDPRFELLLGIATGDGGDRDAALGLLRSAAARPAPDAEFVAQLARVFDQQRLFDDSQALLARAAESSADPAILRVLVQRLWQDGQHEQVIERLRGLDPSAAASDSTLLAFRALSLLALDRTPEALALVEALQQRTADNVAQCWAAAIRTRMEGTDAATADNASVAPAKLIARYQAAMSRGGENGIIRSWIGDAHLLLDETEQAVRQWRQAAELMPSWAAPHVKIARAMLAANRPADAADAALDAVRCAPDQVAPLTTLAMARYALLRQNPSAEEQARLVQLVGEIQQRRPGEPETLPLHVALLVRQGQKGPAVAAVEAALSGPAANPDRWDADTLGRMIAVSREFGLGLESQLLAATRDAAAKVPAVALRHAIELARDGRTDEGLKLLLSASKSAVGAEALRWQVAVAQYREALASANVVTDPTAAATAAADAAATWVALGDSHPDDYGVQSLILRSADTAQRDREFYARAIDRVRRLTGEDGTLWRLARARFLLAGGAAGGGEPSQRDSAEAATLLTDLVRASPSVPEYRVRLAEAMENLGNARDAAEQLRAAAEIDPRSVAVQLELARLLQQLGKHPEARTALERAAASPSIDLAQRVPLARMLADEGRVDAATRVLENAPSRDLQAELLLAELYRRGGRNDDAAALYRRLLPDDAPGDDRPGPSIDLLSAAADFHAARGELDRARQVLARADAAPDAGGPAASWAWARFEERHGDPEVALRRYAEAAEQSPGDAAAWRRLAAFQARRGDYAAAVAAAERGLESVPGNAELQSLRLQAAAMREVATTAPTGEPGSTDLAPLIAVLARDPSRAAEAQALRTLQEAIEAPTTRPSAAQLARLRQSADRFPRFLPLQAMLIRAYLLAGLDDDAGNVARRLLDNLPGDANATALATQVFRATGNWLAMRQSAARWLDLLGPTNPAARPAAVALAEAATKLGEPREAIDALQPFVVDAARSPDGPGHAAVLRSAVNAMLDAGQPERADDLVGPALATSRAAREVWMGAIARAAPDAVLAGEWLARVRDCLDPADPSEAMAFARAASAVTTRFGDPAPVRAAIELLRPLSDHADAAFLTGSMQLQLGQYREAEASYRAALQARPDFPAAKNDLAFVLLLRKADLPEARTLAAAAVAGAPETATYHETLARVEAALGNASAALAAYDAALQRDGAMVEAMIGKAFVLRQAGQVAQSRRLLTEAEALLAKAPPLSAPAREELRLLRQQQTRGE